MASNTTHVQSRYRQAAVHPPNPEVLRCAGATIAVGQVSLTLHRNSCGVLLALEERRSNGPQVIVLAGFTQASCLEDWCTNDPLRFEIPIVHQHLRREAEALWRSDS